MRKLILVLVIVFLLVSCTQEGTEVYTMTIKNDSYFPVYWRIVKSDEPAAAFCKMSPLHLQRILIQEDGSYRMDFIIFDNNGDLLGTGSFEIGNPFDVEKISFSGPGRNISWKITYK